MDAAGGGEPGPRPGGGSPRDALPAHAAHELRYTIERLPVDRRRAYLSGRV